jgi:tRNA-specific 2-thiouridylase
LQQEFEQHVVRYFCDTYALGQTPNPCIACNRHIKFGALLHYATGLGATHMASGHYARIRAQNGTYQLLKGTDRGKDQSYVLYMLRQEELPYLMFPLGVHTKQQVRELSVSFGLPTANRTESQDACFISDAGYRGLLARARPETARPGPICDLQGQLLGEHRGVAFYTVGQRRGLGIAAAHPLYVVAIDPVRNMLLVGPKSSVFRQRLWAHDVHFVSGTWPSHPIPITAKVRYRAPEAAATLFPLPAKNARVEFDQPQPAIAPGQAVVFYSGEVMLGGGTISSSERAED